MHSLKYILLIVIIYVFLAYISKPKMDNEQILQIIILSLVGMWILNNILFKKVEKMGTYTMKTPIYYEHRDVIDNGEFLPQVKINQKIKSQMITYLILNQLIKKL